MPISAYVKPGGLSPNPPSRIGCVSMVRPAGGVSACTGADRGEQDQEHSGRGEQAVASDGQEGYPAAGSRAGGTSRGGGGDHPRLAAGGPRRPAETSAAVSRVRAGAL